MTTPDISLTMELLTIIVHGDEFLAAGGHAVDREAFLAGLRSPRVASILSEYQSAALIPVRRDGVKY